MSENIEFVINTQTFNDEPLLITDESSPSSAGSFRPSKKRVKFEEEDKSDFTKKEAKFLNRMVGAIEKAETKVNICGSESVFVSSKKNILLMSIAK